MLQSADATEQARCLLQQGNALLASNEPAAALDCYDQALSIRPDSAAVLTNRSNALRTLQRLDEALGDLDAALEIRPAFPEALNNRGNVLRDMRRLREALVSFEAALTLRPGFIVAQCNRGHTLLDLLLYEEALDSFDTALALAPDDGEALFGRALALLNLRTRLSEAAVDFDRAAARGMERSECLVGKAAALAQMKHHGEAAACLAEVLMLTPERSYVLGSLLYSRLQAVDWSEYGTLRDSLLRQLTAGRKVTYPLSLLPVADSPELSLASARMFAPPGESLAPVVQSPDSPRPAKKPIRIAYISADFRDHPVSHLLVGVLEQHDRARFEVIGVSLRASDGSEIGRRVTAAFDQFIDAGFRSDSEIAEALRELQVDIAIDLMGYTDGCRPGIFAHRAAPVQVNYLGYPGTSGAPFMDYLIADAVVIPHGDERWYTEEVIRLPGCCLPNDSQRPIAPAPTREQAGLPADGFVFCAFTNAYKINPPVFDVWMRLLREIPDSVLWLRAMDAPSRLLQEAADRGVDAQRLVFAPHVASMAEHLGRHRLADLYLDTFPYNAHSTACDALWAGVPVLTCSGKTYGARAAGSALTTAGLPELITRDLREYEDRALQLARDPSQLQALRQRLTRQSALFDTRAYCRNLETAYRGMLP
jgi:predicted O-linked N-acetylglucosamine transferase (SPINDLY family)